MSDYMFMLENHLSPDQRQVVAEIQKAAAEAGVNLFLTGGAMRDMLGGQPVRDLDFTIEGNPLKMVKTLVSRSGARLLASDELRKTAELVFPGPVTASIGMSRQERYPKAVGRPQVSPGTIHEDLRRRDFTINSIALSLNRASRGLLLDPNNGLADLERKELRANGSYTFYDEPVRLLRLLRLRVRLGFTVDERTAMQYANARAAGMESHIGASASCAELRQIADEPNPGELAQLLATENLLGLFSPALAAGKLNLAGLAKLHKARQIIPFGAGFHADNVGLFLYLLCEKLTPKEKADLVKTTGMPAADVDSWQKLEGRANRLERELKSASLTKASKLFQLLSKAPGDQVLLLLVHSTQRLVQDRIRNYFQKYLPAAQEITEREVTAAGATPGTPKYQKVRAELIATRLDARPKKVVEPPPEVPPAPPVRAKG